MIANPLFEGVATKANPVKTGDAKLRGFSAPRAMPVGPPNEPRQEGIFMRMLPVLALIALGISSGGCDAGLPVGPIVLGTSTTPTNPSSTPPTTPPPTTPPPATPPPVPPASGSAAVPTLPQLMVTSVASTVSAGRTLRVTATGNLQAALDSAAPGDRILLAAGGTFTGNFVLPSKTGGLAGQWITVQSDGALPAEGSRMTPTIAASLNLPKILTAAANPAIATASGSARWRFVGVEVTADVGLSMTYALISLGNDNGTQTLANVPTGIIFDRVYVHGTTNLDFRRCFALNGASEAVVDSYVSECHGTSDAQAIAGWNGPGPFKIVNNYLDGSTENIAFGGADPSITGLVPSDIEIRHNQISKPMSLLGGPWLVKNLLELKQGRRVLIDGNVLENNWPAAQAGLALVLWSVNQNGGCPWCVTEDLTITNNLVRNVSGAFNLSEHYNSTSLSMHRVAIRNNVVIGLDAPDVAVAGGNGKVFQILNQVADLTIEHNTGFSPSNSSVIWDPASLQTDQIIQNNLLGSPKYAVYTTFGQDADGWNHLAGSGCAFVGNVITEFAGQGGKPIAGNSYPLTFDAIGLVGGGAAATSVTAQLSDLALAASSPYKGKATDGTDPGANIAAVIAAIQGVVVP
jgi:hypothetical protein